MSSSTKATPPASVTWTVPAGGEYRFELEQAESIAIQLLQGQAEIFGAEMAPRRWYHFLAECKAAIFSWEGCQIEMSSPSTEYVSEETNLVALSNLHLALEGMRLRARRAQLKRKHDLASLSPEEVAQADAAEWDAVMDDAPRVMVLGPEGSGKTTVCKTLLNWTNRAGRGWSPVFVNLDPAEGPHSPPGALSLTPISHPLPTSSPGSSFGSPLPTGPPPSLTSTLLPLSWYYGYPSPAQSGRARLWHQLVDDMARKWEDRRTSDRIGTAAGLIVDTSGRFVDPALGREAGDDSKGKYAFVKDAIDGFKINCLLVVGHEKLHMEMQRMFGGAQSRISVIKLPKSGGVVDLDAAYRSRAQALQIKSYFYGDAQAPPQLEALTGATAMTPLVLAPHSTTIRFDQLTIYRAGEEYSAPSSALPIGMTRSITETILHKVDPSLPAHESRLLNAVLALVRVPPPVGDKKKDAAAAVAAAAAAGVKKEEPGDDEPAPEAGEELAKCEVAGYVVITAIDTARRKFTILSPNVGKLPSAVALVGGFEWQEM